MLCELFSECLNTDYTNTECGVSYAVRRAGNVLYIFFEASNGTCDWIRNLDFPAKAYKRMGKTAWYAHRGFLTAWHEIKDMMTEHTSDKSVKKAVVTGYSHGAAIALLCHEHVWFTRPDLRAALKGCGFGCPRVIWGVPCANVRRRWDSFSVVRNIDDAVTHLPPALLGYTHVGNLVEIGKRGKYSSIDAHRPENIMAELTAHEKKSE